MSGFVFPVLGHILTRGKLRGLCKEVLIGPRLEGLVIDLRGVEGCFGSSHLKGSRRGRGKRRKK